MGDTVVIDGDMTLIKPVQADCELLVAQDGESGASTVVIDGDMTLIKPMQADCELLVAQDGESGASTAVHSDDYYTGAVEVTPSAETQTLFTESLVMASNITVNPIPSNYGLIEWDGSTLRVS